MIILDFGSGNSSQNKTEYVKKMLDELKTVDSGKHQVVIKWQLFEKLGENIPLKHEVFDYAYKYAEKLGYETTASVFHKKSLDFLLKYDVPFIKIACLRDCDWLIGEIPRKIDVYVSYDNIEDIKMVEYDDNIIKLLCIRKYPAKIEDYEKFDLDYYLHCGYGYSDHTIDFELYNKYPYKPDPVEWHYVLKHDKNNLDAGTFARTPKQLKEIL